MTVMEHAMTARPDEFRRDGRRWVRTATGSTVRRLESLGYRGDSTVIDDLRSRFASNDPARFLPLPHRHGRSSLWVDIWIADADRTAFAVVAPNVDHRIQAQSPIAELTGPAYDALVAAKADGSLERATNTTPLDEPAPAASAPAPAPGSPPPPTRSEPTRFWYDPDFARRLLDRNRRRQVGGWIVAAVGLLVILLGALLPAVLLELLGVVVIVCGAFSAGIAWIAGSNARQAFGRGTGDLLVVDDDTISFELLPNLPWSDVTAVSIWDRREMLGATVAIPYRNWAESGAVAYGQSSGIGQTTISFVVRDGEAARARLLDPRLRSFVALGKRRAGHPRPGQILITPDTALPFESVVTLVQLIRERSEAYGFPLVVSARGSEYLAPIERALDPAKAERKAARS